MFIKDHKKIRETKATEKIIFPDYFNDLICGFDLISESISI